MAKKTTPKKVVKKVAPKKVAPKKAPVEKVAKEIIFEFADNDEVIVDFKGVEKRIGGFNAKILIKKGVAKFIKKAE